jgi:hypothetical protein
MNRLFIKKRIADLNVSTILSAISAILFLVLVHFLELGVDDLLLGL